MKVLLTGAAGYAGSGIAKVLAAQHWVRSLDVRSPDAPLHDAVVGDIADLPTCERAVEGIDAAVLCHMARSPEGYTTPVAAVDVNVKGTANLYHAMAARGIKRAVLISTCGVLRDAPIPEAIPGEGSYNLGQGPKQTLYGLSKVLQEVVCRYYFETAQIVTTILRPWWVVYDESLVTKYGTRLEKYDSSLIDPRDIGEAVVASLALRDPRADEAFTLVQTDSARDQPQLRERLGWSPRYRFEELRKQGI